QDEPRAGCALEDAAPRLEDRLRHLRHAIERAERDGLAAQRRKRYGERRLRRRLVAETQGRKGQELLPGGLGGAGGGCRGSGAKKSTSSSPVVLKESSHVIAIGAGRRASTPRRWPGECPARSMAMSIRSSAILATTSASLTPSVLRHATPEATSRA